MNKLVYMYWNAILCIYYKPILYRVASHLEVRDEILRSTRGTNCCIHLTAKSCATLKKQQSFVNTCYAALYFLQQAAIMQDTAASKQIRARVLCGKIY